MWKQRLMDAAEVADAWRIVPRAIIPAYAWALWIVSEWFMGLPDPSGAQMGFVSTVWGAGGMLTGWYFSTGRRWDGTQKHTIARGPEHGYYSGPGIEQPQQHREPNRWDQ